MNQRTILIGRNKSRHTARRCNLIVDFSVITLLVLVAYRTGFHDDCCMVTIFEIILWYRVFYYFYGLVGSFHMVLSIFIVIQERPL